ncbi:MAG: class I SAM-dependent methyltransferase [Uliginosibacterium sp.]|nr:class I SAM-dependent methyltransferase [Uliginosibacterium sp.]
MEADKLGQGDIAFQANLYESANPSRRWLHGGRRAWVTGAIQRFARRRGTRFLEIGIGCGLYTAEMARLGPVLAIDINPGFVAAVAGLENVEARVEDVTSLSLRPSYDVAVCSEVIEHLPGSQRALANISQALRPGGVLILTTPHAYSTAELFARLLVFPLVRGIVRRLYAEHVEDLGHINRLTRAALLGQIHEACFDVLEQYDCGLYLPGVAEFCGKPGQQLAAWLEGGLRRIPLLRELLWTQCYVLRKKQGSDA